MHWFARARGDWTDKDYLLMLALTVYEDGLCSCGHPVVIAHHKDNDGWYTAHKRVCNSCAARERSTKGVGKEAYTPAPGERVSTTYDRPADKPMRNR